jgi:hypothetical protein
MKNCHQAKRPHCYLTPELRPRNRDGATCLVNSFVSHIVHADRVPPFPSSCFDQIAIVVATPRLRCPDLWQKKALVWSVGRGHHCISLSHRRAQAPSKGPIATILQLQGAANLLHPTRGFNLFSFLRESPRSLGNITKCPPIDKMNISRNCDRRGLNRPMDNRKDDYI